jgi:hypothetical protein
MTKLRSAPSLARRRLWGLVESNGSAPVRSQHRLNSRIALNVHASPQSDHVVPVASQNGASDPAAAHGLIAKK